MKPLFEKLDAHTPHWKMTNIINTLIDHLKDYEAEQDRRLTELDNRIQRIANNQLKMKRGEVPAFECNDCAFGKPCAKHSAPEQPKRWRGERTEPYIPQICWCGQVDCMGAEVEAGGIVHRPDKPCYELEKEEPMANHYCTGCPKCDPTGENRNRIML